MSGLVAQSKVIAFDSWTKGAEHVERLVPAFRARGLELLLIHIGSWGHDPNRPDEEFIGKLLVRDTRFYAGLSFAEILLMEKPVAVLFLSMQALVHRAFNRYCAQLGIPTVHLYHGIVTVQNTASSRMHPVNARGQLAIVLSRVAKNLTKTWPVYVAALWRTRASPKDWYWFLHDVYRQVTGRAYTGVGAPDTATTACCVYVEADSAHATQRYRIESTAVVCVGNPDLGKFGMTDDDIGICLSNVRLVKKQIVYIDTALLEAGAVYDDADDFVRHLLRTHTILARQGFKLIVKLHPAHYRTGVIERLSATDIEACDNQEFINVLKTAAAAIAEPSSAALIPALLGIPLFLARYGKLRDQTYGDVLTEYPFGMELFSLDDIGQEIEVIAARSAEDAKPWFERCAGPLPHIKMPERVAAVVADTVEHCPISSVASSSC